MIEFPCHHCPYQFSVPQELAGTSIQCPKCGILIDVPTLGDRDAILPDGTYRFDAPEPPSPKRLAETMRVFSRQSVDESGNEKDLRPTLEDIRRAGVKEVRSDSYLLKSAPRYDPETGELIQPIPVPPREQDAADIPMAKAAVSYAMPGVNWTVGPAQVWLELLKPMNAFVMSFILIGHLIAFPVGWAVYFISHVYAPPLMYIVIAMPLMMLTICAGTLVAHYACTILDIGREDIDELPRPLRSFNLIEDFFNPLTDVVCAVMFCYAPFAILSFSPPASRFLEIFAAWSLGTLGTILFPAVLLTTLTSGTLVNLRPDRVLGVIRSIGWRYLMILGIWVAALACYAATLQGIIHASMGGEVFKSNRLLWACSFLLLLTSIYLMHAWCWQLALVYRGGNAGFPWAYQRHIKKNRVRPKRTLQAPQKLK